MLASENLRSLDLKYNPIFTASYGKSIIHRAFQVYARKIRQLIKPQSQEALALSAKQIKKQVVDVIKSSDYDVCIIHYWYLGFLFQYLSANTLRMIDTHYMVEEHMELLANSDLQGWRLNKLMRELSRSLLLQRKYFLKSDLVVVNSQKQARLIHEWDKRIPVSVVVNGQNLTQYLCYRPQQEAETAVCFYGALSNQFNRKALIRILSSIFPKLKAVVPGILLYVIGSYPPKDILDQYVDESIVVTGYVDDIRPWITKCKILLLPLETGSGFRGRVVEVMSLGVPIIGSSNALQSTGFMDGIHGYIEESDEGMVSKTVLLLKNPKIHSAFSENCKEHARSNFTLESSFGKLISEINDISTANRVHR